jgi:hypothetical protein
VFVIRLCVALAQAGIGVLLVIFGIARSRLRFVAIGIAVIVSSAGWLWDWFDWRE